MKKISVYPLFPKIIGTSEEAYDLAPDELFFLKNLKREMSNNPNYVTENKFILNLPELKNLKIWIQENLNTYFYDVLKIKNINKIFITQSWSNLIKKGQRHVLHDHPNSIIVV